MIKPCLACPDRIPLYPAGPSRAEPGLALGSKDSIWD
jgi:hypothetical protein